MRRHRRRPAAGHRRCPGARRLKSVADVVRSCGADTVAVTSTAAFGPSKVRQLSWDLEDTPARLILAPAITNVAGARIHTRPVAGLPLIHVDRPTYHGSNRILKRSFNISGSVFLILVLAPLLLAVAAAIKLAGRVRRSSGRTGSA